MTPRFLPPISVAALFTLPLFAQEAYQGPQVDIAFQTSWGVPSEGDFEALDLGDPDGDGFLDALILRGGQPFWMSHTASLHSAHLLAADARDVCISHLAGDDRMMLARATGLEAWDVQPSATGEWEFQSELVLAGAQDGVREVLVRGNPGLAVWSGSQVRLLSREGGTFQVVQSYQVPGAIRDVVTGDFDLASGLEVAVLHTGSGGQVELFEEASGALVAELTAGGPSFLEVLQGSSNGLDLLIFKSHGAGDELVQVGNTLAWEAPIQVTGLGVDSAEVYDYFGDGEALLLLASATEQVFVFHHGGPLSAGRSGYELDFHSDPSQTYRIDLPPTPGGATRSLLASHGDLDQDGDRDLALITSEGTHLRLIPGEPVQAESERIQLAQLDLQDGYGEMEGLQLLLEPIGCNGEANGVVLPAGATHVEVTLWACQGLEAPMEWSLGQERFAYAPGEVAEGRVLQADVTLPAGFVPVYETIYHLRIRAVEEVAGQVLRTWPSRTQVITDDEAAGEFYGAWELPNGWNNLLPTDGPAESDGSIIKRTSVGGPTVPGSSANQS